MQNAIKYVLDFKQLAAVFAFRNFTSATAIDSFHNCAIYSTQCFILHLATYGKYSTIFHFDPPMQNT